MGMRGSNGRFDYNLVIGTARSVLVVCFRGGADIIWAVVYALLNCF